MEFSLTTFEEVNWNNGELFIFPINSNSKLSSNLKAFQNKIDISIINVLDLFSGTGIISFEFSSRGVKNIVSVDKNYNCVKNIKKTSDSLNLNIKVVKHEVISYLKNPYQKFSASSAPTPDHIYIFFTLSSQISPEKFSPYFFLPFQKFFFGGCCFFFIFNVFFF